jgi:hypothetical protein
MRHDPPLLLQVAAAVLPDPSQVLWVGGRIASLALQDGWL